MSEAELVFQLRAAQRRIRELERTRDLAQERLTLALARIAALERQVEHAWRHAGVVVARR